MTLSKPFIGSQQLRKPDNTTVKTKNSPTFGTKTQLDKIVQFDDSVSIE